MWKQMNHNDSQSTFVTVIEAYQPDEASPLPTTRLNADKGLPALPSYVLTEKNPTSEVDSNIGIGSLWKFRVRESRGRCRRFQQRRQSTRSRLPK